MDSGGAGEIINEVYQDTLDALEAGEGCKLSGFVFINKVPGNFHISMHHYPAAYQRLIMRGMKIDFSHKINHLSFGNLEHIDIIHQEFESKPTIMWELDGREIDED